MDTPGATDSSEMSETVKSEAVGQFCSVTGSEETMARTVLESCNWNLELAINMYVDQNDGHIDASNNTSDNHVKALTTSASTNQMDANSEDNVRPPIPPVRQVLVDDFPQASYSNQMRRSNPPSVFDPFRDFEQEARWHEQQMDTETNASNSTVAKRRTLEDLFRPPLDLICRGTLEFAKEEGQRLNKWLMINIQNHREFSCQVLNRDVWSNTAVKSIISDNFVFWQTYHHNSEGQRFMQFYNVVDFPYVAILDPRTGEKLRHWTTIDPVSFCDLVTEFLHDFPSPSGSTSTTTTVVEPMPLIHKSSSDKALYEESEEMQIKAAIAASLKEVTKNEANANHRVINDVDDSDLETFGDSDNEDDRHSANATKSRASVPSLKTKETSRSDNTSQEKPPEEVVEDYRLYLGPENGSKFELVVRFPDGNRENIIFPSDSQLKALFLYLSSKGYNMKDYDIITNFPKRNLKEFCSSHSDVVTLESAGIHSRDTLYVQHKT